MEAGLDGLDRGSWLWRYLAGEADVVGEVREQVVAVCSGQHRWRRVYRALDNECWPEPAVRCMLGARDSGICYGSYPRG